MWPHTKLYCINAELFKSFIVRMFYCAYVQKVLLCVWAFYFAYVGA